MTGMAGELLERFVALFQVSFCPPHPYRGERGNTWLISRVWTEYLKWWLSKHFKSEWEVSLPQRRRLDAAIWFGDDPSLAMDIALEWEWDNAKVHDQFPEGDFVKVLKVDAHAGLAIVHTRVDGNRGVGQAQRTVDKLRRSYDVFNRDQRPVDVIEVRRVYADKDRVDFEIYLHDLGKGSLTNLKGCSFDNSSSP